MASSMPVVLMKLTRSVSVTVRRKVRSCWPTRRSCQTKPWPMRGVSVSAAARFSVEEIKLLAFILSPLHAVYSAVLRLQGRNARVVPACLAQQCLCVLAQARGHADGWLSTVDAHGRTRKF